MVDMFIETITYELSMHKTNDEKGATLKVSKMNCFTGKTETNEYNIGIGGYIDVERVMADLIKIVKDYP